jgi:hypothetical protein
MYTLGWTLVPHYIDLFGVNLFRFLEPSLSLFGWVTNCHFLGKKQLGRNLTNFWKKITNFFDITICFKKNPWFFSMV